MNIAIYSRKSKFTGKGDSIGNQVEMCKEHISKYIDSQNTACISVYEDEGFSAKNLDRPQFKTMMQDHKTNKFDYIIVYRLDRISRSVSDFSALVQKFENDGTKFICIKEQFDTSTPMGKSMMYIASVFAQLERETIAERVRDNLMMLARTGRWLGGTTPTGYSSEKLEIIDLSGKNRSQYILKEEPREIDVVKIIYKRFLETRSLNNVSKHLNSKGITSRLGKPYSILSIKDILCNPVYCTSDKDAYDYFSSNNSVICFEISSDDNPHGLIAYNKRCSSKKGNPRLSKENWIIAEGQHKGLIKGSDWVNVQSILNNNILDNNFIIQNNIALLSGLIRCSKCGKRMFVKMRSRDKGTTNTFDYICETKTKFGVKACDCPNLSGSYADEAVYTQLQEFYNNYSEIPDLISTSATSNEFDSIRNIDSKITELSAQIENMINTIASGNLSSSTLEKLDQKINQNESELYALKEKKEMLDHQFKNNELLEKQKHFLKQVSENFMSVFNELDITQKREYIRILVSKIEWDGTDLHIFMWDE